MESIFDLRAKRRRSNRSVLTLENPTLPLSIKNSSIISSEDTPDGQGHRPCHCLRSKCVKLYCECFASGMYCDGCNCIDCQNNVENDAVRTLAIANILDRKPYAFKPKISSADVVVQQTAKASEGGVQRLASHNRGCHCLRTRCVKNYCECFHSKIECCANCKCVGCKNVNLSSKKLVRERKHKIEDPWKNQAYIKIENNDDDSGCSTKNNNKLPEAFNEVSNDRRVDLSQQQVQIDMLTKKKKESSESNHRSPSYNVVEPSKRKTLFPAMLVLTEVANFLADSQRLDCASMTPYTE